MHESGLKELFKFVQGDFNKKRLKEDRERFLIYNGKLKGVIKTAIEGEYIKKSTVKEMINRIVPINITQKIIDKLSALYTLEPLRESVLQNPDDDALVEKYEKTFRINKKMKFGNRMYKLHKHNLMEPYLNSKRIPKMRILPSHTFTLWSDDLISPEIATVIIKHLKFPSQLDDQLHAVWTDERHWIVDGHGRIKKEMMIDMNNEEGINPFGVIPFVHINEAEESLYPIPDDDLISMQIIICLLLTDLAFALKYQAWSIVFVIAKKKIANLDINPNALIQLPIGPNGERPEIGTLKPQLDSDALLRVIEALVAMLLSTKSLSVSTVAGKLDATNAASGLSKLFDEAESTEDRKDQIAIFSDAEVEFFDLFAHKMLPVWVKSKQVNDKFVDAFTDDFQLQIKYPEVPIIQTRTDKIKELLLEFENDLTTQERVMIELNPGMGMKGIKKLMEEIMKEKLERMAFFQRNMPAKKEENTDVEDNKESEGEEEQE